MSAIGLISACSSRTRTIGAHADYRRDDFIFPRTQSNASRAMPWRRRIKPRRPLGELYGYAALAAVGLATAMTLI